MTIAVETPIEQLAEGLTRHYLYDKQIVVFTVEDIHQHTIDAWAEAVKHEVLNWPAERPFLNIHNFLNVKNMSFTPYIRKKSAELTPLAPDKVGRTALVLPRSLVSQIVHYFLRTQQLRVRPRQVFFKMDDALQWCEALLKDPTAPK